MKCNLRTSIIRWQFLLRLLFFSSPYFEVFGWADMQVDWITCSYGVTSYLMNSKEYFRNITQNGLSTCVINLISINFSRYSSIKNQLPEAWSIWNICLKVKEKKLFSLPMLAWKCMDGVMRMRAMCIPFEIISNIFQNKLLQIGMID